MTTRIRLPEITAADKEEILGEKSRVERLSRIRQFVFGSMDGLLVPLGVVSGVAAGTGSVKAVVVAGLAEAFAGALSMAAGEYLSGKSEAQVHEAEIRKEQLSIHENPEYEVEELALLLENEGVERSDARLIARKLRASPKAFVRTMVEKEFGLNPEPRAVRIAEGVTIGVSYLAASIVPLGPYFFLPIPAAFPASMALTLVVLIAIGIARGTLARIGLIGSALEVLAVGVLTGGGGYLLGCLLPKMLGY